jgi:hypothetical protein
LTSWISEAGNIRESTCVNDGNDGSGAAADADGDDGDGETSMLSDGRLFLLFSAGDGDDSTAVLGLVLPLLTLLALWNSSFLHHCIVAQPSVEKNTRVWAFAFAFAFAFGFVVVVVACRA